MPSEKDIAWIASLVGDPARSRILLALMDGRPRTAKELAFSRTSPRRPRAAISQNCSTPSLSPSRRRDAIAISGLPLSESGR
jgi:hypothetical protein